MRKGVRLLIISVLVIFTLVIWLRNSYVTFKVEHGDSYKLLKKTEKEFEKKDILLLCYEHTTGPGWFVIESTVPELKKENVALLYNWDPRLLKKNKDFGMDYSKIKYIVVMKRFYRRNIKDESIIVIEPETVIINDNGKNGDFFIKDMQVKGILKFICGLVEDEFRLSW